MALNYYRLLGIPPDADQNRIKSVYRSLAKRFHPDANHGSEAAAELFRQVNQAYKILSNSETRAAYDRKLAQEEAAQEKQRPGSTRNAKLDPQQKFNRFLNSLLDALIGPDEPPPRPVQSQPRTPPQKNHQPGKPAFNFYYHQAMEQNASPYIRGSDGVYRKAEPKRPTAPPDPVKRRTI